MSLLLSFLPWFLIQKDIPDFPYAFSDPDLEVISPRSSFLVLGNEIVQSQSGHSGLHCYEVGHYFLGYFYACMSTKSFQSCPTLCYLTDCSPPGSSVHGILQARRLEWVVAIPFAGDLPNPGIEPRSPAFQADLVWATKETIPWIKQNTSLYISIYFIYIL